MIIIMPTGATILGRGGFFDCSGKEPGWDADFSTRSVNFLPGSVSQTAGNSQYTYGATLLAGRQGGDAL